VTEDPRVAADAESQPRRFEVTVHAAPEEPQRLARVADLDLDRVPDPDQGVRLLVSLGECARLIQDGFEVRVLREVPVRPLDPGLITSDEEVRAWFSEQTRGAAAEGES
jgi:hypothetical protein